MNRPDAALVELGRRLQDEGYRFVAVTPRTHELVNARAQARDDGLARNLRDVFGWSRPFRRSLLPHGMLELLRAAGACADEGSVHRSKVRFASLQNRLFVHSAFPTHAPDSVFFGPDTYRFVRWLGQQSFRARRLVDVGAGAGAAGLLVAEAAERVVLTDVNPRALAFCRINAALAGVEVEVRASDVLQDVDGPVDVVVANPPYIADPHGRTYRDGGGDHGEALSLRIVREALHRLPVGGTIFLYTGTPVIDGADIVWTGLQRVLADHDVDVDYGELDPDVFGEELAQPAYAEAERIAVVGLRATVRAR